MTNEEAIAIITEAIEDYVCNHVTDTAQAQRMLNAVQALEQEPSGDTINRQALLEDFGLSEKTRKWGGDHSGYNTMMLYEIQDMIESAPSVKPQEPKTEHWIFEGNQCFSCSSCGRIYTQKAFEYLKLHKDDSDFPNNCPNCGAKMVEPQEGE